MKALSGFVGAVALLATPVLAQDDPQPDYYGVWKGTIGTYPVMACAMADGLGNPRGAYYYMSSLAPIGLGADDEGGWWNERVDFQDTGARWNGIAVKGDALSGTWTQDGKSLPIKLARQKWQVKNTDDGPCLGDSFLNPRMGGGKVVSANATSGRWAYRKLTYVAGKQFGENVSIETLALAEARPGDRAINQTLAKDLPDGTYQSEFIQCFGMEIGNSGSDGYFGITSEPDLLSNRWLDVTVSYEMSCGGAHPNSWYSFRTFDRDSGAQANLFRWLNDKAVEHVAGDQPEYDYDKVLPPLRKLALTYAPDDSEGEDPECPEAAGESEFWYLGLSAEGMQMVPSLPHVLQACTATYVVPWAKLKPWLSAEGKAGLAALEAD